MKRVSVVATTYLSLVAATLEAAPPADDALVQSAIAVPADALNSALEISRRRVADAMSLNPDSQIGGVIVFARGLDSQEVAAFAESYEVELTRAEAKVASSTANITQTMSFGSQSLFSLDDPLDVRLEKLLGHQRAMFMAMAKTAGAPEAANFREAAYSRDIRFYKVEVVGPASSFDRIEQSGEAAAVFVDGSQARVEELAAAKANAARRKAAGGLVIKGRPYDQGPPPGVVVSPSAALENLAPPDPPAQQPNATQPAKP